MSMTLIFRLIKDKFVNNIITLILIFFSLNCFAEVKIIKKTYIIGVEKTNNSPLMYINRDGEFQGIFRNYLDKFARDQNISFIYKALPIQELYQELFAGKIDFKFPDNPVWRAADKKHYYDKYEKKVIYSTEVWGYLEGFFLNKSSIFYRNNSNFNEFNSLRKLGFGKEVLPWFMQITRENKIKQESTNNNNNVDIILESDCNELLKLLNEKKLEAIYCNYDTGYYYIKKFNLENIIFEYDLPNIDDFYFISTIKYPSVIEFFDEWHKSYKKYIHKALNSGKF